MTEALARRLVGSVRGGELRVGIEQLVLRPPPGEADAERPGRLQNPFCPANQLWQVREWVNLAEHLLQLFRQPLAEHARVRLETPDLAALDEVPEAFHRLLGLQAFDLPGEAVLEA